MPKRAESVNVGCLLRAWPSDRKARGASQLHQTCRKYALAIGGYWQSTWYAAQIPGDSIFLWITWWESIDCGLFWCRKYSWFDWRLAQTGGGDAVMEFWKHLSLSLTNAEARIRWILVKPSSGHRKRSYLIDDKIDTAERFVSGDASQKLVLQSAQAVRTQFFSGPAATSSTAIKKLVVGYHPFKQKSVDW